MDPPTIRASSPQLHPSHKSIKRKLKAGLRAKEFKLLNRPRFRESDLKVLLDIGYVLTERPAPNWWNVFGDGVEAFSGEGSVDDDLRSIASFSTNATMDDNIGAGLAIDKYFYQPVGRALEKLALKIGTRFNICYPSPAHILRHILDLYPKFDWYWGNVRSPSVVIDRATPRQPTVVAGLLSLVKQSQSNHVYRSYSALAALIRISASFANVVDFGDFYTSFADDGSIFHLRKLADSLGDAHNEKTLLLSLVNLGWAVFISMSRPNTMYETEKKRALFAYSLRQDLLDTISSHPTCHDELITYASKASLVFAKAFPFIYSLGSDRNSPIGLTEWNVIETTYFTITFLIRSINRIYLEGGIAQCATMGLRHLFLSTLFDWFRTVANQLLMKISYRLQSLRWVVAAELLRSPFNAICEARPNLPFPIVDLDKQMFDPDAMPRRVRRICLGEDPPSIRSYATIFLSRSRRLLLSTSELEREVRDTTSVFKYFITNMASTWTKHTDWSKEQLKDSLGPAQTVQTRGSVMTEEFLDTRDHPHLETEDMLRWKWYQERRESRRQWGQALQCNLDWGWNLSGSLRRLFFVAHSRKNDKLAGKEYLPPVTFAIGGEQRTRWTASIGSSARRLPEVIEVAYRTEQGAMRYKKFHAAPSVEDVTADSNGSPSGDSRSVSVQAGSDTNTMVLEDGREYERVLECREINRHARRKIEAWLNDGWCIEWKWNGQYEEYFNQYKAAHWMSLKRGHRSGHHVSHSPSSGQRSRLVFPETPEDTKRPWPRRR